MGQERHPITTKKKEIESFSKNMKKNYFGYRRVLKDSSELIVYNLSQ